MSLKIKHTRSGEKFTLYKTKKPTMSRGTWDSTKIFIDHTSYEVWCDVTWGSYFYIKFENHWYKIPIMYLYNHSKFGQPDIDQFIVYNSEFEVVQ